MIFTREANFKSVSVTLGAELLYNNVYSDGFYSNKDFGII